MSTTRRFRVTEKTVNESTDEQGTVLTNVIVQLRELPPGATGSTPAPPYGSAVLTMSVTVEEGTSFVVGQDQTLDLSSAA